MDTQYLPPIWLRGAVFPALLALVLGALSAIGFAPLDLWPVTLLCLAAWMAVVHAAPTRAQALLRGWLFGVGHFTLANNWIQHAFTFQDAMPHWLGYLAVALLAVYLAIYPMLAAALAWRFARSPLGNPPGAAFVLVFGAGWIATEWLRAGLFSGYAWGPLAVVWLPVPGVALTARWIGTYALSGVTILGAGALLLLAYRRWRFAMPVIVMLGGLALADLRTPRVANADPTAPRVRVVQPNLDQEERPRDDYTEQNLQRFGALAGRPGPAPRLVVWPEGAIRYQLEDGYPPEYYSDANPLVTRARIAALLGPRDIVLTGSTALNFDANGDVTTATNSVFAVDERGRLRGRYDKAHLVPYGEYLPARPLLTRFGLSRLVPGDIDFLEGPGPRALDLPAFGRIGVQICYEIIFSGAVIDEAHRPRLLFNPSNDAWFGDWGPPQHLAQARLRAIEEGVPIVRSTPTGISAIIDADGRLLATLPQHETGAIELPIPPLHAPTPFARFGNALACLVAAAMLLLAVAIRRSER